MSGYLQIGRDTLPAADWQTATSVPGAFRALPITRAIVATQTTIQALDDADAQAYDDLASIGFWNMDPSMAGAELWWLGTAAAGEVLSVKTLNNDLIWTVALMLTPAQVANLSFDVSIETVPEATTSRFGLTRYATDAQAEASEANASEVRPPTMAKLWTWWNALTTAAVFAKLPIANGTQGNSANNASTVMTPQRVRGHIVNWWANVLTTATLLNKIPLATATQARQGRAGHVRRRWRAAVGNNPGGSIEENVSHAAGHFRPGERYTSDGQHPCRTR